MSQLRIIIKYCESSTKCRRILMALQFGEVVDPAIACAGKCDICKLKQEGGTSQSEDVSKPAKDLLNILTAYTNKKGKEGRITMKKLATAWKPLGKKKWKLVQKEKLISSLFAENCISFRFVKSLYKTNIYIIPGESSPELMEGRQLIFM